MKSQSHDLLDRLLRREVNASNLLGFVIARDALPIESLPRLDSPVDLVRFEVPHPGGSRMDVVLYGADSRVLAVIEAKVAASEHGNQLERYSDFAAKDGAQTVMADLELEGSEVPEGCVGSVLTLCSKLGGLPRTRKLESLVTRLLPFCGCGGPELLVRWHECRR